VPGSAYASACSVLPFSSLPGFSLRFFCLSTFSFSCYTHLYFPGSGSLLLLCGLLVPAPAAYKTLSLFLSPLPAVFLLFCCCLGFYIVFYHRSRFSLGLLLHFQHILLDLTWVSGVYSPLPLSLTSLFGFSWVERFPVPGLSRFSLSLHFLSFHCTLCMEEIFSGLTRFSFWVTAFH